MGMTEELERLISVIARRRPLRAGADASRLVQRADSAARQMYTNHHERKGIAFQVQRLAFPGLQAMDAQIARIAPGKSNERQRHAHESICVVLEGEGRVLAGEVWSEIRAGDVFFIARGVEHQTWSSDTGRDLVILAITDFLLTSAVLGDYDRHAIEGRMSCG
jgi:quercetin dioxygenase-like cupin family protein